LQKTGFITRIMHEGGAVFLSLFNKIGASKAPFAPQKVFHHLPSQKIFFYFTF